MVSKNSCFGVYQWIVALQVKMFLLKGDGRWLVENKKLSATLFSVRKTISKFLFAIVSAPFYMLMNGMFVVFYHTMMVPVKYF